jgi:serine/threonine-protein kinase
MDGDSRVRQLLEELLDSEQTPEEVCRDYPKLLPEVRRRWQRKCACDAQLDALFPGMELHSPFSSPSSTPSSAELPRIPGYEVLEVMGRGGMGVVYKARHLRLDRPVALKMLLTGEQASRESREHLQREAKVGAGLRHPNIVQVHDMGDQDGLPYFTMELVEGGNLAQKLAGMPQPPRQAAALLATLAEAVQAAHRCGIVHRDLKPANVLLTADGTPKICDLGLARRLDGEAGLTWTGTTVGTPSYMAPEQAEARPRTLGPAVDIHALGAILYELLTGRPPFRAATAAETLRQVISQDPVPPSRLNGEVPRDLETICLKCLHKEPHLRYADAAALAADLHHFLGGEAIAPRPEGRLARLFRRARRRPVQSKLVAAIPLLTSVLLGGGLWLISGRAGAVKSGTGQAATERAADTDLREMVQWMRKASWPEARNALERAKSRLGERGPHDIRGRLDRGARDLELADRPDAIRLTGYTMVGGVPVFTRPDERYEEAFREAGFDEFGSPPESLAAKTNPSDIRNALLIAFDNWSFYARDPWRRCSWRRTWHGRQAGTRQAGALLFASPRSGRTKRPSSRCSRRLCSPRSPWHYSSRSRSTRMPPASPALHSSSASTSGTPATSGSI